MSDQLLIALLAFFQPDPEEEHAHDAQDDETREKQWMQKPPDQSLDENRARVNPAGNDLGNC